MQEFNELIHYCELQYIAFKCTNCPWNQCFPDYCGIKCSGCIHAVHQTFNVSLNYPCAKSLYLYVLPFQSRYASEIDRALWWILKDLDKALPISLYSIGCGPASELYGFIQSSRRLGFQDNILTYKGFDFDNRWSVINAYTQELFTSVKISFEYSDSFSYIDAHPEENITFLVMNYLLSDVVRRNQNEAYIIMDKVYNYLVTGRIAFVLINDIFLFYQVSAYSCIQYLKNKLSANRIHFNAIEKRYSQMKTSVVPPFGDVIRSSLTIINPQNLQTVYNRRFNFCNSITSIIYKTA